jgi:hypothetical protein
MDEWKREKEREKEINERYNGVKYLFLQATCVLPKSQAVCHVPWTMQEQKAPLKDKVYMCKIIQRE